MLEKKKETTEKMHFFLRELKLITVSSLIHDSYHCSSL